MPYLWVSQNPLETLTGLTQGTHCHPAMFAWRKECAVVNGLQSTCSHQKQGSFSSRCSPPSSSSDGIWFLTDSSGPDFVQEVKTLALPWLSQRWLSQCDFLLWNHTVLGASSTKELPVLRRSTPFQSRKESQTRCMLHNVEIHKTWSANFWKYTFSAACKHYQNSHDKLETLLEKGSPSCLTSCASGL